MRTHVGKKVSFIRAQKGVVEGEGKIESLSYTRERKDSEGSKSGNNQKPLR